MNGIGISPAGVLARTWSPVGGVVNVAVHCSIPSDAVLQVVESAPTMLICAGSMLPVTTLRLKYSVFPWSVGVPITVTLGVLITLRVAVITNQTTSPAAATSPITSNAVVILNAPLRFLILFP